MIKIINSEYDEECGYSCVEIETEVGKFLGSAWLDPRDEGKASSFFGCEIAEYRAYMHYYEVKRKMIAQQYVALLKLKKDFKENDITDEATLNLLNKRIKQKEVEKNNYAGYIKSLNKLIKEKDRMRDIVLTKIAKKKEV